MTKKEDEIALEDELSSAYISHHGILCPLCGSDELSPSMYYDEDETALLRNVQCLGCNSEWTELFQLVGIEDILTNR